VAALAAAQAQKAVGQDAALDPSCVPMAEWSKRTQSRLNA
jgi:hypothetical protein